MNLESFRHYKLDIEKMDEQHFEILCLVNDISRSKICDRNIVLAKIQKLETIVDTHLKDEEAFMEEINFPYRKFHHEHHITMRSEIARIISFVRDTNQCMVSSIDKISDMFFSHVDHDDTQYGDYYKNVFLKNQ